MSKDAAKKPAAKAPAGGTAKAPASGAKPAAAAAPAKPTTIELPAKWVTIPVVKSNDLKGKIPADAIDERFVRYETVVWDNKKIVEQTDEYLMEVRENIAARIVRQAEKYSSDTRTVIETTISDEEKKAQDNAREARKEMRDAYRAFRTRFLNALDEKKLRPLIISDKDKATKLINWEGHATVLTQGTFSEYVMVPKDDIITRSGNSKLGEGAFGKVYRGFVYGSPVAVKELKEIPTTGQDVTASKGKMSLYEAFKGEALLLKELKHDNILKFLGACFPQPGSPEPPYYALITELAERGSLSDILYPKQNAAAFVLSFNRKMKLIGQIAAGLNYLHNSNPQVLHLDLKPANILLDADFNVRIADFGLSKIKASEAEFLSTAKVGTPFYMAPEIMLAELTVKPTTKSDVYSFGIMINEILDERVPYTGVLKEATLSSLQEAVKGGEEPGKNRPRLPNPNAQVPQLFLTFITECWASDPEKRPAFEKMFPECPWDKAAEKRSANSEAKYKKLFELFKDDKKEVSFKAFTKALATALDLEGQIVANNANHYHTRGLQAMMGVENIGQGTVTRESVERFIQWFGGEQQVLPYIYSICCKKWFFGVVDLDRAKEVLSRSANSEPGTFLVRWEHAWRISWVDKKDKAMVADELVSPALSLDKQQVSKLITAVENFIKEKKLKNPATGRALLISGVEIKENFVTGGSGGCYLTEASSSDTTSSSDAPSNSKHYNFIL